MPKKQPAAGGSRAPKTRAAKPPAPVIPGTEAWREPAPLAPLATGDADMDRLLTELRRGMTWYHLPPELQSILSKPSASQLALLVGEMSPEALDACVPAFDQVLSDRLEARERKGYLKLHERISSAFTTRYQHLRHLLAVLAADRSTEERVLDVALHHADLMVRGAAGAALVGRAPWEEAGKPRPMASPGTLSRLTEALDAVGESVGLGDVRVSATRALFATGPSLAAIYDRLAPLVEQALGHTRDTTSPGAETILLVVGKVLTPLADPRWSDLLARVLREGQGMLQLLPLEAYARIPLTPAMEQALFGFVDAQLAIPFLNANVLPQLGRCKDPRAAVLLARALAPGQGYAPQIFETLRRFDVAASAVFVRKSVVALDAMHKKTGWPMRAEAESLAAWLERNGPASAENVLALSSMPPVVAPEVKAPSPAATSQDTELAEIPMERQRAEALEMLKAAGLGKQAAVILAAARPAIVFVARPDSRAIIPPGTSRLGGAPDVPAGFEWPIVGGVALRFVGQFDLAEITALDVAKRLPAQGLLSFFVCDDVIDEPGAPGYAEVAAVHHFTGPPGGLHRATIPPALKRWVDGTPVNDVYPPASLTFRLRLQLPPPGHAALSTLGAAVIETYTEEVFASPAPRHQLLGFCGRDSEPSEVPDTLLLQVASDDRASMSWGDVDELCFYVAADALRAGDFSRVVPHVGD
ncbi:MAG: YwqG family protein [Deltaproteobacteria bacterium]